MGAAVRRLAVRFYDRVAQVAAAVFPTMLEPLVSREG